MRWLIWVWLAVGLAQVSSVVTHDGAVGRALPLFIMAVFFGNAALWWWLTGRAARAERANTALLVPDDQGTGL